MSNPQAGGLDLDAIAARLKVLECGFPHCGAPDCDAHRLSLSVIEECRALRTALRPFAERATKLPAGMPDDYQSISAQFTARDVRRAAAVLGVAPERDLDV